MGRWRPSGEAKYWQIEYQLKEIMTNKAWNYYCDAIEFTDSDELSDDYIGFSPEFVTKQKAELIKFLDNSEVGSAVGEYGLGKVVYDFWLTRNRHGAGFWDGDYEEGVGKVLTDIAHAFGEVSTSEGDDHLLYS